MKSQAIIQNNRPQLFDGHAVDKKVVVPGAFYLLQAIEQSGSKNTVLKQVEFLLPLFQSDLDESADIEIVDEQSANQTQVKYKGQIVTSFSRDVNNKTLARSNHWLLPISDQTTEQAYAELWQRGNQFGGNYRILNSIRKKGGYAQFQLDGKGRESLHVLDACLHSVLLGSSEKTTSAHVLMRIESCQLFDDLGKDLQVQVEYQRASENFINANLQAVDDVGRVMFLAKGVQFCSITQNVQRTALVQGNFTLDQVEEVSSHLNATFNLPYQIDTESYIDWRHALSRPKSNTAAYDTRVLVLQPSDLIKPQALHIANGLCSHYLPNGIEVAQINQYETDYLYREIFIDRCYGRHGISIEGNDVVIDVGANIGMFSLYALQQANGVKVYAFEPSPRVADCLRANTLGRGDVEVVCAGVAEQSGEATFSFYPNTSVFSSFFSSISDDEKVLREVIANQVRKMTHCDDPEILQEMTETMLQDRLQQEDIACPLINLSEFIQNQGIEEIGLLKIDAEKAELGILRSLSGQDFARIRQICLEVHDAVGDQLQEALTILKSHGFIVHCEEEVELSNTGLYTVTARRQENQQTAPLDYRHYGMQLELSELHQSLSQYASKTQQPLRLIIAPSADQSLRPINDLLQDKISNWIAELSNIQVLSLDSPGIEFEQLFSEALPDEVEIPYSALWYGLLGRATFQQLVCIDKTPHKLIVVDADNTLWRGVVGEQGTQGIELTSQHLILQRFLIEQYEKGVMLAVCSKNIESDVMQVLDERSDMLLKRSHFVAFKANWQAKSTNIHELTTELSISLDSVIFIDDNPIELAEVTGTFPQVLVLQFNDDEKQLAKMMKHWAFNTGNVTAEDLKRSELYQINQKRGAELLNCQSYKEFLAGLKLQMNISNLQEAQIPRIAQLTERTNQFNATKGILNRQELASLMNSTNKQCLTLTVQDKYGDYGLVGAAFYTLIENAIVLDNILLSCRALGKGIEERFLSSIAQKALDAGKQYVVIKWRELPRNLVLRNLYSRVAHNVTVERDVFQSEICATKLHQLEYVPVSTPPISSSSKTKSTGLSLQYVNECYSALADIEQLVDQIWPEHDDNNVNLTDVDADALELNIARMWFKVLGKPIENLDDDFFGLGGNSLRLVRILGLIYSEFGVKLSLFEAFEHKRTIRQQAAFIRAKQAVNETIKQETVKKTETSHQRISENQLGIYFSQLLNPDTSAYNVPLCFELGKEFSYQAIVDAVEKVAVTQSALRTGYRQQGRRIEPFELENWFDVNHLNINGLGGGSVISRLRALTQEPFKLNEAVVKLTVLETEHTHILLFVLHHMYCDLTSMEVFLDNFLRTLTKDEQLIIERQVSGTTEDLSEQAKAFWIDQTRSVKPLPLPVSVDSEHQRLKGKGHTHILSNEQSLTLEQYISDSGVSSFVYLFGSYCRYLSRTISSVDFAVGTPVCLRDPTQAYQIGNFVNLLPICVTENMIEENWKKEVEKALLNALEYKAYPFIRMVRDSGIKTDTGRSPLVQTTFAFHEPVLIPETTAWFGETTSDSTRVHGQQITLHGYIQQSGQTDIACEMFRSKGQFGINVKYDSNLLSKQYVEGFLQGFIDFIFNNISGDM